MSVRRTSYAGLAGWSAKSVGQFDLSATGGTVTTGGGYKTHTFTSTGSAEFKVISGFPTSVDLLIVAGGGGCSSGLHGGAGAGGLLSVGSTVLPGPYSLTIGAGGASGDNNDGGNSTGFGFTAVGGGGGVNSSTAGRSGGSGSGGGGNDGSRGGGSGTLGQGNAGGFGAGTAGSADNGGGGGGGAGAVGANRPGNGNGGNGGVGVQNSLSGSVLYYAGGGGGGRHNSTRSYGTHGAGEGTNRGGGGQPGPDAGDDGIIIVRYVSA